MDGNDPVSVRPADRIAKLGPAARHPRTPSRTRARRRRARHPRRSARTGARLSLEPRTGRPRRRAAPSAGIHAICPCPAPNFSLFSFYACSVCGCFDFWTSGLSRRKLSRPAANPQPAAVEECWSGMDNVHSRRSTSAVPRINIGTIWKLVSSRDSFHAPEEVHRSTHPRGTRGLSRDDPEAQRQQREGPPSTDSVEGRCGRTRVDRPADRRRLFLPHQHGRERSPTMRAGRVRGGRWNANSGRRPRFPNCWTANRRRRSLPCVRGRPRRATRTGRCGCWRAGSSSWRSRRSISHETVRRALKKTG